MPRVRLAVIRGNLIEIRIVAIIESSCARSILRTGVLLYKTMKKQTKNLITSVIVTVLVIGGGIGLMKLGNDGSGADFSVFSASVLAAYEGNFDFGTIAMNDGVVKHQFEVKNEGTEPVTIGKVYTSCMCTTASIIDARGEQYGAFGMPGHSVSSLADVTVNPGESITVETVFDPAAHGPSGVGLAQRSVYLETNSQTSPKIELTFRAMVKP